MTCLCFGDIPPYFAQLIIYFDWFIFWIIHFDIYIAEKLNVLRLLGHLLNSEFWFKIPTFIVYHFCILDHGLSHILHHFSVCIFILYFLVFYAVKRTETCWCSVKDNYFESIFFTYFIKPKIVCSTCEPTIDHFLVLSSQDWKAQLRVPPPDTRYKTEVQFFFYIICILKDFLFIYFVKNQAIIHPTKIWYSECVRIQMVLLHAHVNYWV